MPEMSSCVPRHALLEPVLGLEGASLLLSEGTKRKGYLVIRAAVRAPPSASWAGGGGGTASVPRSSCLRTIPEC